MSPRDWLDRLRSADSSIDEELRFHVEERVRELIATGRSEEEARAEVLRAFGDPALVARACRPFVRERMRREALTAVRNGWRDDLRLALRGLVRQPRFGLAVIATLALGLGAAAAVFTVVDGILLRPLPYRDPDQLVIVRESSSPTDTWPLSVADYLALAERQRAFTSVGAYSRDEAALTGDGQAEWVSTAQATASLFPTLGIEVEAGRLFTEVEDRPGGERVAVVTDGFASRRFGAGADAIGRTLVLDGEPHTVIGRLAPGAPAPSGVDVWVPFQMEPPTRKGPFFFNGYARLREGVDLAAANADLARVSEEVFAIWAGSFPDRTAQMRADPLKDAMVRSSARALQIVQAAVAVLLLIACANVANLVLARASVRRRELQVRAALGAGRARLARMLAVEGAVLAGVAAAVGLIGARAAVEIFRTYGPELPRVAEVAIGPRTIGLVVVASVLVGLGFGLVALLAGDRRGARLQAASDRSGGDGGDRLRGALVVAEFALALPLVVAAALLGTSLLRLQRVDPGFDAAGLGTVRVSLPRGRYPGNPERAAFWAEALGRVRALPEVQHAGVTTGLPPDQPGIWNDFELDDRPGEAGGGRPSAPWLAVDAGYFEALGVPLLDGRLLGAPDVPDTPPVVLVSRSWAERYYPDRSAVGARMQTGGCTTCDPTEVVGVVEDIKFEGLSGGGAAMYEPLSQGWWAVTVNLVVRARGPVGPALERVTATLHELDPNLPLTDVATLEDKIRGSLAAPRHWSALVGSFSLAAALLAAVGVLGLLSYSVSRRTREIGVRMALGAGAGQVVAMVVRGGMVRAAAGIGLGLILAFAAAPLLESQLFGVAATDPFTLAGATALLLTVALTACWLPARRAARVEPTRAIAGD